MPTPRQPQDHQSKADTSADDYFSFSAGGTEYTMPHKTLDVITTGFVRQNRRRDEVDYVLTCVEALAGDGKEGQEILAAFDSLTRAQLSDFMDTFREHLGVSLGE